MSPHIVKSEIYKNLAETLPDMEPLEVRAIVDKLLEFMVDKLLEFNRIEIRDFGVFSLRPIRKNKVRNPRYGVTIDKPMISWMIHFKPGKQLASRVRSN